jgi:hypothetical protein
VECDQPGERGRRWCADCIRRGSMGSNGAMTGVSITSSSGNVGKSIANMDDGMTIVIAISRGTYNASVIVIEVHRSRELNYQEPNRRACRSCQPHQ